jgi:REP element-mobilizing transposase RayT
MARKLRVEYPGAIYHITHRGNAKQPVFSDDHDRERFLLRLAESVDTYNVRLYMFCLMKNHIHLVCETPEGNVSRFMQSLITGYTVYYNLRHESSGHLFQGRFGSKLVEGDSYLLALTRYVHLNPVYIAAVETAA